MVMCRTRGNSGRVGVEMIPPVNAGQASLCPASAVQQTKPRQGTGLEVSCPEQVVQGGLLNCFGLFRGNAAPSACTDGGRRVEGLGSLFSLCSFSSREEI